MPKWPKDAAMIQLLLKRLNDERLPHALKLKDRVERGERINDYDVQFLKRVFDEASTARRLAAKHPELGLLVGQLTGLYSEITQKALENEQGDTNGNHASAEGNNT